MSGDDKIMEHDEYIMAFKLWMKQSGYTLATKREYEREASSFLDYIEQLPLEKIKKLTVVSYLVQHKEHVSEATRNRTLAALRSFFKAMNDFEMMQGNPAIDVKKSKTEKNVLPVYLEQDQLQNTMSYIDGKYKERNIAIFLLMAYSGLRVGEVHRLNLSHYHGEKGSITVLGKGRKWNEIPLSAEVNTYMQHIMEQRLTPYKQKEDAFFVSQKGRRLSIRQIQKIMSMMFQAMKEDHNELRHLKLSCHKLRHSFATLMLRNQVDIRIVKELMGHTSIETTMIYTHIQDDDKKQAISSIQIPNIPNLEIVDVSPV